MSFRESQTRVGDRDAVIKPEASSGKPLLCTQALGCPQQCKCRETQVVVCGWLSWADAELLLNSHSHHLLRKQASQSSAPSASSAGLPASVKFTDAAQALCSPGANGARTKSFVYGKGTYLFSFHPATRKAKTTSIITSTHHKIIASCPPEGLPL